VKKKSIDRKLSGINVASKKLSIKSPQVIQIRPEEFAAKLRKN